MILESIQSEFLRALKTESRDWYRIRQTLDRVHREIRSSAGTDPWSEEYGEYLVSRMEESLAGLIPILSDQEEYEQALEVKLKLGQMLAGFNIQLTD